MTIGDAEKWACQQLQNSYVPGEAHAITQVTLEHLTGLAKADRLLQQSALLTQQQQTALQAAMQRLLQHEPVQYVFNKAWFYNLNLYVNASVLIPRPETEELVQWIIDDVKTANKDLLDKQPLQADKTRKLRILDVGTGSGCIALALKNEIPMAEVWGCDVSEEALNIARRNASVLNVRVDFQGVDFLNEEQHSTLPFVNTIVSNPPYVPLSNKTTMQQNVLAYEPHLALFVPNSDPLIFYKALARFGQQRLHEGGCIYMEIHEDLGKAVTTLFENNGYQQVTLKTDMQGKQRMVKAEKVNT